jgi:hypothetical protein
MQAEVKKHPWAILNSLSPFRGGMSSEFRNLTRLQTLDLPGLSLKRSHAKRIEISRADKSIPENQTAD